MTEPTSAIEQIIERESGLVDRVRKLEARWNSDNSLIRAEAQELLEEAASLADEVTPLFIDSPISSLNNARFGWAVYEIANARLNLTYLLLFGVNQVKARHDGLVPGDKPGRIPDLYVTALLSEEAKDAVLKRLAKGNDADFSDEEWAGLIINAARDAADAKLKQG